MSKGGSSIASVDSAGLRSVQTADRDARLGRKLAPTPEHLSRAIYVPYHDDGTVHVPLYDVTGEYESAVDDAPIGSSDFNLRLFLMRRPAADSLDHDVAFLANMDVEGSWVVVKERTLGPGQRADLCLLAGPDEAFRIYTESPGECSRYAVKTTFPLPAKQKGRVSVQYPHFSMCSLGEASHSLEWRVCPLEKGPFCYTLVDTSRGGQDAVRAVYNHMGIGEDMSPRYSEGVLLLPRGGGDDALVVSSLLSLLRFVRRHARVKRKTGALGRLGEVLGRLRGA